MRIKSNTEEGRKYRALIDGENVKFAVEADDEAGWVIALALTDDGRIQRDEMGQFVYQKLTGVVTLEKMHE